MTAPRETATPQPAAPESPGPTLDDRMRAAAAAARTTLLGHGIRRPQALLDKLSTAALADDATLDMYGKGGAVAELEAEVAELLGKESAAFMPSGIMAQQCILRVWSDLQASPRVAVHAMSHLVVHELSALSALHRLDVEHLTAEPRPVTADDLAAIPGRLGAVSIELPLRDAGHLLPSWDELVALSDACRARDVPLHIDGARLWESTAYWGRSLADVAALADSVYVSFYKGLDGLAGAAVAGPKDVIDEARRWQRRHGGVLITLLPYAVSALAGLHEHLPQMPTYHEVAVEIARHLTDLGLTIHPDPPHTTEFFIHVPAPADVVRRRLVEHTERHGEIVARGARPADVPGWSTLEFRVGAATCKLPPDEVADRIARVLLGPPEQP